MKSEEEEKMPKGSPPPQSSGVAASCPVGQEHFVQTGIPFGCGGVFFWLSRPKKRRKKRGFFAL